MSHGRNQPVASAVNEILSLHIKNIDAFQIKEKTAKPIAKAAIKNRDKLSPLLPVIKNFIIGTRQQLDQCQDHDGKMSILQHAVTILQHKKLLPSLKKIHSKITWNSGRSDLMDINLKISYPTQFTAIKSDFKSQREMCEQIIGMLQDFLDDQNELIKPLTPSPDNFTCTQSNASSGFFYHSRSSEKSESEIIEEKSQHSLT